MNEENGGLNFGIGLDLEQLKQDGERSKSVFDNISKAAQSSGDAIDAAFQKGLSSVNSHIEKANQVVKENQVYVDAIQQRIDKLSAARDKIDSYVSKKYGGDVGQSPALYQNQYNEIEKETNALEGEREVRRG